MAQSWDDDLRLAMSVVDQVDALTLARFGAADLQVRTKPDLTPVTEADTDAERAIRSMLQRTRPRDMVVGEEMEPTGHGRRQWVLDPIDGTKNFVRGRAGVGDARRARRRPDPRGRRRVRPRARAALVGGGRAPGRSPGAASARPASCGCPRSTTWPTRRCRTPRCRAGTRAGLLPGFLDLTRRCWRTRAYGDFWSYMLLAEGAVDVACEPELALHDMAALVPIVTEAGGRFTSLDGEDGPWGPDAVATNGALHAETLAVLRGGQA